MEIKLDNEMKIIHKRRDSNIVKLLLRIDFGGLHESKEDKGIAHFIEHMLFTGTKNLRESEIKTSLEKEGAYINAFTFYEETCIEIVCESGDYKKALRVIKEMITNTLFLKTKVNRERKIILEEFKRRKNNFAIAAYDGSLNMFQKPFSLGVLGTKESISNMTREKLKSKYEKHYVPSNFQLCIIGDVETKLAVNLFKNTPKKQKPRQPRNVKTNPHKTIEHKDCKDQSYVSVAFPVNKQSYENPIVAGLFNNILGDGFSSRLFKNIRDKKGYCYSIDSNEYTGDKINFITVVAGVTKGREEECVTDILREVKSIFSIKKKELANEIKRYQKTSIVDNESGRLFEGRYLSDLHRYGMDMDYLDEKINFNDILDVNSPHIHMVISRDEE